MLTIDRDPIYKNKLFLGGVAVMSGFVLTMGIIRLANPVDNTTSQSTQSTSDRRAASLIPISASESESSSEGSSRDDTSAAGNVGTGTDASSLRTSTSPSTTGWPTQSATQTQPATSPSTSTTSSSSSQGTSDGSSGQTDSGSSTNDGATCQLGTTPLGIPILGKLSGGVCVI